ncbi:Nematode resistance protein-like HSPRO2 [Linum grandiflorum]
MVGLHCKSKMLSSGLHVHIPPPPTSSRGVTSISPVPASDSACSTYEQYLRLPELRNLWSDCHFPDWKNESILKPALHALEITFRFVSTVLSDPRPYANKREWKRRLESLAAKQIQLIAVIIEDEAEDAETRGTAPLVDLSSVNGVLERESSYAEVWKYPGGNGTAVMMVNRASEASLLPPLGTWHTSEDVAQKIMGVFSAAELQFSTGVRCVLNPPLYKGPKEINTTNMDLHTRKIREVQTT